MNKILFMLCIASGLITTTTFTMGIDNQPEEKNQEQSDEPSLHKEQIEQLERYFKLMARLNIQLSDWYDEFIPMDFERYQALDSWALPAPEYKAASSIPHNQQENKAEYSRNL